MGCKGFVIRRSGVQVPSPAKGAILMNEKELYNARLLGGIGSLLMISPLIFHFTILLTTIGIILLFISLWKFAEIFQDKEIFNKFLIGFLIGFVGVITGIFLGGLGALTGVLYHFSYSVTPHIPALSLSLGLGLFIFYVANVIKCYFYKKAFEALERHTKHRLFYYAGLTMFISSFFVLFLGIGLLGLAVGWILLAVAFFTLDISQEQKQ